MSGATQVTINITASLGFTFPLSTFSGIFNSNSVTFTRLTSTTAQAILTPFVVSPGIHTFTLLLPLSSYSPAPAFGQQVAAFAFKFNDIPSTTLSGMITANLMNSAGTSTGSINCIHGKSLIATRNGLKRIDQLQSGDEVLSGKNLDEYAKIKFVAQCWIQYPGPDHDAIIFEPGSLGPNEPSEKLIIDPGHPMCTKSDFLENGLKSLRPAGSYIDDKTHICKWIDPLVQEESSVRYDLILEEPYSHYVANDIVIQSHGGYDHRYKDLI